MYFRFTVRDDRKLSDDYGTDSESVFRSYSGDDVYEVSYDFSLFFTPFFKMSYDANLCIIILRVDITQQ